MEKNIWTAADLLQLSGGYWSACALHAGVKLDVFTPLSQRTLTAPELAGRLKVDPREVFGTNCVKFAGADEEVCRGWLKRELRIVQPKLVHLAEVAVFEEHDSGGVCEVGAGSARHAIVRDAPCARSGLRRAASRPPGRWHRPRPWRGFPCGHRPA